MAKKIVWRIKKEYFHQLKDGGKSLEIRVGYPHIRKVSEGDIITFENYGKNEFAVKRVAIYGSFKQLLETEGVDKVLPGMTFDGALRVLKGIYPREKENLGVYAFELKYLNGELATPTSKEILKASQLLKRGENKKFAKLVADAYCITDWIVKDYPEHCDHFFSKYVPGIFDGSREIVACYAGDRIAAVAILKKADNERKICTFYVRPEFQRQGIATELIGECFKFLGTTKPLITIADYKIDQFEKIIEKYHWEKTKVMEKGYYNDHSCEVVYNGEIS